MSTKTVTSLASRIRFGLGQVDITPPVGIYHRLWGAARHDRATGVHRPLYGQVMALGPADGSGPMWLRVQLDHAGVAKEQHEELTQALSKATGVPREHIVITYSHTHSGGWLLLDRLSFPGGELIPVYLQEMQAKLVEAARAAVAHVQEVLITYGTGHCNMAANRDYWDDAYGGYVCGFNPDAPADDTVLVGRVTDKDGRLVAVLVNYACHATTLAWENTLISPDYVGAMREEVERATGVPCVFLLGTCGDLGPRDGFVGDTAVADKNGRQLAYAALSALMSLDPPATDFHYQGPVISGATLGTWAHVPFTKERWEQVSRFAGGTYSVDLPLKPRPDPAALRAELEDWLARQREADARGDTLAARDYGARAERARRWLGRLTDLPAGTTTYPLRFSVLRMGDAVWIACGGEPYSLAQVELRRRFPHLAVMVSPLGGDLQIAYLLPADRYGKGLYQEEPSILAPGCLERLIDAMAARVAALC